MRSLIILFLLGLSSFSLAESYYYEDKEMYYADQMNLLKAREINAKKKLYDFYKDKKIKRMTVLKKLKEIDIKIAKDKKKIERKWYSFGEYERNNNEECDYKTTSINFNTENALYHGLWHIDYAKSKQEDYSESNVAIIDGYLSSNRLLPNLKIKNCLDSNNVSCNRGLNTLQKDNNIFGGGDDHTYWVTSIIGGHNCGNKRSELKVIGINPKANLLVANVSRIRNGSTEHSLNKTIEAIKELNRNDINVIYTPLVFTEYTADQKIKLEDTINDFLKKPNRVVVAVAGNENNASENDHPLPCILENVICVGGLDRNGTIWKGSSPLHKYVDIYAPSADIIAGIQKTKFRIKESGVSGAGAIVAGELSKVIKKENYKEEIARIKKGSKFILNKDGTINKEIKGI